MGVGCYQVLLLLSKNDHITPKWQSCLCRVGFHAGSSGSFIPCHTCYKLHSCLMFAVPHCLVIRTFSEQLLICLYICYENIIIGRRIVSTAQIQFLFKVYMIKIFMHWLFSSPLLFLLDMRLNSNYETKYL